MKKTKLSFAVAGLMLAGAVIMVSCTKKTTTTTPVATDTSTTSSTDNNMAQQHAHDITNIGSEGIENNNGTLTNYRTTQGGMFSPLSQSVTVVIDTTAKKMTVTFNGYYGHDGHLRNGTLVYDWSASTGGARWFRDAGFVLNVTTPGNTYSVDNYTVEINQKTIKNLGVVSGNYTWSDASNITVVKPNNGGNIQWQGNWTSVLLNTSACTYNGTQYSGVYPGSGSPYAWIDWAHAILSITGNFSGTASDGETYTGNISAPLVLNLNCSAPLYSKYLYVAGTLNFTPTGKATRTINYGTGTCDLTYVVSIGSYSITITI
ncbi:MAG TPA: hypothetical protein VK835_06965 [Bacteroidia bacterium]|jgi:hypothetical protein|nr:hypothetical protein [Bacteroidia bacterium]